MGPRLPKFRPPPLPHNPLKDMAETLNEGVSKVAEAISGLDSIATQLTEATGGKKRQANLNVKPLPDEGTVETSDEVMAGTACNLCSSEHFSQVAGDLAEAMRFARKEGLSHREVIRRVENARQELNEMERYDLSPAQIQRLSGPERVLAEWALLQSREIRHLINAAITTRQVSDLEKAAAQAEQTATEFLKRLWELPTVKEECPECADLKEQLAQIKRRIQEREAKALAPSNPRKRLSA